MDGYVREDGSRRARKHNNANFYVKNYSDWVKDGVKAVSYHRARDTVRGNIGLEKLPHGEDKWGDYRANGDAWGGHGLKLERMVHRGKKCFLINSDNLKMCKEFLSGKTAGPKILL